jgi:CubicO group peptidase (beta-lactamase class C family)
MLRRLLLVTLATLVAGPALSQAIDGPDTAHRAPPQRIPAPLPSSTFSPERLARMDGALQKYVDDGKLAGIVALVLQDGQPVYERAFGWSDKERGVRMTADTIFRIASQTKALTTVSALMLMEEGKLGLNDPVSRFIPAFKTTSVAVAKENGAVETVPAKREITIKDLMTHTAGISYGTQAQVADLYKAKGLGPAAGQGWYTADKDEKTCDSMERLATLPFIAQPGEKWVYGYNTDVLGCVVERASGMALDEFFRTRITQPLGMKDTHFFLPRNQRERLAAVYASGPNGKAVRAPDGAFGQGHYVDGPRRNFAGGAGLVSTAQDYARFLEMIRNDGALGDVRLLSPRSVALMRTNQVDTKFNADGLGFGLGFMVVERYGANGLASPGTFGWGGAYGSTYAVDPGEGLTVVLMIQLMPNQTDIQDTFRSLVYQALVNPRVTLH